MADALLPYYDRELAALRKLAGRPLVKHGEATLTPSHAVQA